MSFLKNTVKARCWNCTERQTGDRNTEQGCEREWKLVRAFYHIPGKVPEIIDAFECCECGQLVPTSTWQRYISTGDVVVKRPERKVR